MTQVPVTIHWGNNNGSDPSSISDGACRTVPVTSALSETLLKIPNITEKNMRNKQPI